MYSSWFLDYLPVFPFICNVYSWSLVLTVAKLLCLGSFDSKRSLSHRFQLYLRSFFILSTVSACKPIYLYYYLPHSSSLAHYSTLVNKVTLFRLLWSKRSLNHNSYLNFKVYSNQSALWFIYSLLVRLPMYLYSFVICHYLPSTTYSHRFLYI